MSFFAELKRRNVLRTGAAYVVAAWLVIQAAETIFPVYGLSDAAIRLVITVLAIGLVPVLVISWAFELTPEGLKKELDVDRSQSVTRQSGKKLDLVIIVMLALALVYFAFDKFVLDPQREAELEAQKAAELEEAREEGRTEALTESYGENSIAVLAFKDMSPDKDQEYLSDGIAEELLNVLAKIPDLRVISRSSAFSYKGKDIKLTQVADELNVAHILEGSVRKAGNRVRITAQLVESRSDTHLWSETYDRTLDDIFAIQDEIAATVVEQLKVTLLGDAPRVRATNPEAYSLMLQARHFSQNVTAEGLEHANVLYEQALAIDPDYAPAWVGLAVNYNNLATNSYMPFDEGFRRAREAANRALAVDPDNSAAYAHLGWIAMWYDRDLAVAAGHYERALSVDPSNFAIIGNAALLLKGLGRLHEAVTLLEYHAARDPVNPTAHYNLGLGYLSAGRWEESIAAQRTVLQLSPDYIGVHSFIGTALVMLDDAEAALEAMSQEPSEAYRWLGLVMANQALGRTDAADAVLTDLIEKYEQNWAYNIAYVLAFRKDADRAFEWLDKAVEYGDPGLADIVAEVLFSHLYLDPRWTAFLERIGKAPAQLRAIEFDVAMPN